LIWQERDPPAPGLGRISFASAMVQWMQKVREGGSLNFEVI